MKMTHEIKIVNGSSEKRLQTILADTWVKRLVGLLLSDELNYHQSMCLKPCKSIHTIGMGYPIDVVFVNRFFRLLKL